MKIGLFDSGVGGLNVLKEFIKKYPNNHYIYYGDTINIPYGDKDKNTLLNLASNIIHFFEEKKVDLIIIACGTVSSNCYNELKKITKIKIIDIISPTINYLKTLEFQKGLVIGTKRTIDSHIFKNNISNIIELETSLLVPMIEDNKIDDDIIKNYVNNNLDIEVLVFGCTHYPVLKNNFKKYLKNDVIYIDMGKVLVNMINLSNNHKLIVDLYFTKIDNNLLLNIKKILDFDYNISLIR